MTLVNKGDNIIATYNEKASAVGLVYPVIIKIMQAFKTAHAHSFHVVNTDKGLENAL